MRKAGRCYSSWSILAVVALILFSALPVGSQPITGSSEEGGTPPSGYSSNLLSLSPPSPWFYYPTSSINILILYDLSTGAPEYTDEWNSLLGNYGYNVTLLSIQLATGNTELMSNYDLILVDHSCGGDSGVGISSEEANVLSETGKPLVLLGGAHGVIDRLANYGGGTDLVNFVGNVQKSHDKSDYQIYMSPYAITETLVNPPDLIQIFNQGVSLESYPENAINGLYDFCVTVFAPQRIIGALYSAGGSCARVYWWAFQDPSKLNSNGRCLFINTIEWMGGFTNLEKLCDSVEGTESMDMSKSTYWTGGFGDFFEPQIPATYYAYESLRLVERLSTINTSALVDWLTTQCYSSGEDFFRSPYRYLSSSWSGVAETGMVLQILSKQGSLYMVNLTRISAYLKSCQVTDGFVRYPGDSSKSVTSMYWALVGLNITGSVNTINRAGAISYILSCQNTNPADTANYGGFANSPGGASYASYTYMALRSLNLLDSMNSVDQTAIENWLMNGYVASEGMFYQEQVAHQRHLVNYGTGYSVASLSLLGRLNRVNQSLVAGYLSSTQFSDGGWSGAKCTYEPIDEVADCYPVILGLSKLGRISTINDTEGFVGFLARCLSPTPTYGFSNLPRTMSNVWQTYNAVAILRELGLMDASRAERVNNSILSSYDGQFTRFESLRFTYPAGPDGYIHPAVEQPFEFSFYQRDSKGVISTDMAIVSLLSIGSKNWIGTYAQQLWNEITSCEVTTGSFGGYYKSFYAAIVNNLTAGMRYTYHALNCLWILAGFLDRTSGFPSYLVNASATIEKVMSLYDSLGGSFRDDGYILEPYSSVETTFMALASLQLLNAIDRVDYIKTTEFLESNLYSDLVDTYYSFKGLQALNRLSVVNVTKLLSFIEGCQKPSGLFESDENTSYRLQTTRMATEILSYYNHTWVAAKQIGAVCNSIGAPSTMELGSHYSINLTLADSRFGMAIIGANAKVVLGDHEFTGAEMPDDSGKYIVDVVVPIDLQLLGTQSLVIRASKDRLQTSITQTIVEILRGSVVIKTPIEVVITQPSDTDHLVTCNTSITALVRTLNESQLPIAGAELRLYVNDSLADTMSTNSSGLLTFSWKPQSSGTYDLEVAFDGSETFNASQTTRIIHVGKTPTSLSLTSDHDGREFIEIGSTVQLTSRLLEINNHGENGAANETIAFMVLAPSGTQSNATATTGSDGAALLQITTNEEGNYSVCSVFQPTGYYSGSTSGSLLLRSTSNSTPPGDGGGGSGGGSGGSGDDGGGSGDGGGGSGDNGELSWFDAFVNAIASPVGIALLVASGGLLSAAWLLGFKQRELESLDGRSSQRSGRRTSVIGDTEQVGTET